MLLWLDLETTGLIAHEDYILEVAWSVTDNHLIGDDVYTRVVYPTVEVWKTLPLIPYVYEMHTQTGLITELESSPDLLVLEDIEDQILETMRAVDPELKEQWMLAGASVHFDKAFVEYWMPRLHSKLIHRIYDTTTLRTFFQSLNVIHGVENYGRHRAYHDIVESLGVARAYREYVDDIVNGDNDAQR